MGKTICVLADACAMPVKSLITKFRKEFEDSSARPAPRQRPRQVA